MIFHRFRRLKGLESRWQTFMPLIDIQAHSVWLGRCDRSGGHRKRPGRENALSARSPRHLWLCNVNQTTTSREKRGVVISPPYAGVRVDEKAGRGRWLRGGKKSSLQGEDWLSTVPPVPLPQHRFCPSISLKRPPPANQRQGLTFPRSSSGGRGAQPLSSLYPCDVRSSLFTWTTG